MRLIGMLFTIGGELGVAVPLLLDEEDVDLVRSFSPKESIIEKREKNHKVC